MLSWTLQILAQKPGRGSCCCMRRVSIYIDVSSLYPVQGTALTYAPGGCRTFMHYEAVLLAQHPHFTVMIHGNNIISLKLFAFFLFFGFWFFHPEPLSQNIRKALSFLDACEKSNLLDTDHTITSPSILGSDQLFVWWFFTLSQVSIVIFIVKHFVWKLIK